MWDLPIPGLEPVSPALASGFLTTAPPGKSLDVVLFTQFVWEITEREAKEEIWSSINYKLSEVLCVIERFERYAWAEMSRSWGCLV